jgi:hypothetical protein
MNKKHNFLIKHKNMDGDVPDELAWQRLRGKIHGLQSGRGSKGRLEFLSLFHADR